MADIHSTDSTIEIPLTTNCITTVDAIDADLGFLPWRAVRVYAGYWRTRQETGGDGEWHFLHRTVLERKLGRSLSKGEYVDHIDGNGLNNCRSNLRPATHAQNMRNRKINKTNTTGYKGVMVERSGRFRAQIKAGGKRFDLGIFDTAEEAHKAYCAAATELHGEFARFE